MRHTEPSHETLLALKLASIALAKGEVHGLDPLAWTAHKVCQYARSYRKLNERGCNGELSPAQNKRMIRMVADADALLKPYGLEMGNPYGLVMYALPIGSDGMSSSSMTVIG